MIRKNFGQQRKRENGFTMTELLVAMAMTAIVMAAVYSTYKSQQDSYVAQEQVVEMQQNIRASFYQLARDLRMAGYNPLRSSYVGGFTATKLVSDGNDETTTTSTHLAFYMDLNTPGIPDSPNGRIGTDDDEEQIAYRFFNNALQKFRVSDDTWQTVADNIDAVDFVYLDPDGTDITNQVENTPTALSTVTELPFIDSIRSVEISIGARTGRVDNDFTDTQPYNNLRGTEILSAQNDHYRRRLLSTTIFCRNLGT